MMRFLTGSAHARLVREMDLLFGPSFSIFSFFILSFFFLSLKCTMRNESICQDRLGTNIHCPSKESSRQNDDRSFCTPQGLRPAERFRQPRHPGGAARRIPQGAGGGAAGKKTVLSPRFMLTMIVLPRQARDKHRESTQKRVRFLAGACC